MRLKHKRYPLFLQNYVMQFVLEHGSSRDRALIISRLRGQMLHMACHKFASNVCEKALILADPESRRILIDEIIARPNGVSPVVAMMRDQYVSDYPDDPRFFARFLINVSDYEHWLSSKTIKGSRWFPGSGLSWPICGGIPTPIASISLQVRPL